MTSKPNIRAVFFDAYGTLFDVHSVVARCEEAFPGKGIALSQAWRTKQLEYTWLRSLGERYAPFWQLTQDGFDMAVRQLGLTISSATRTQILESYFALTAYPEVRSVLTQLRAKGIVTGTLSNGSPEMLSAVIESAGLADQLDHVVSVDEIERYKPDPKVYVLGVQKTKLSAAQILFVSSNAWDIAGASWFGYPTFWVNRAGAAAELLGATPVGEGRTLSDVLLHV